MVVGNGGAFSSVNLAYLLCITTMYLVLPSPCCDFATRKQTLMIISYTLSTMLSSLYELAMYYDFFGILLSRDGG